MILIATCTLPYSIMSLTETAQIQQIITRSQHPLVVVAKHGGIDAFASAIGMKFALAKMNKPVTVVSSAPVPKALGRIVIGDHVRSDLPNMRTLVVELDTRAVQATEIKREDADGRIRFLFTPNVGTWSEQDINVSTSPYPYDLVICIGASDLAGCGEIHTAHADFLYRTPIINIDHSTTNEHFGQMNIVDLTATSCAEVCHNLVNELYSEIMDEEIATLFLTGMIAKTKSFKARNVTPKTLNTVSALIEKGARREEIITNLYRVRSVSTLRLWGRALARLKHNVECNLVWTLLSQQDFLHAGAQDDDLLEVVDELIFSSPDAEMALLLYEDHDRNIRCILRVNPPHHATQLLKSFSPSGTHEEAHVRLQNMSLVEAERIILDAFTQ